MGLSDSYSAGACIVLGELGIESSRSGKIIQRERCSFLDSRRGMKVIGIVFSGSWPHRASLAGGRGA